MVSATMQKILTGRLIWLISLLGWFVAFSAPALADPPARAGRVAEVVGDAWLFDAENKEWTRVTRNQTVAEGDRLRTDERSRISLRVGSSSLWLDERSDLEFTQLDEGRVLLSLDKGDLGLRLRSQEAVSEYKVQTREGMAYAEREGLYRVEQLDRGSRAFALQGRLRFESSHAGDSAPVWLQDGEQAEFWWGSLTGARTERQRLVGDGFTDWLQAQSRAEGDNIGSSQRYVSPEMTGAEELDRHGRWEQAPDYGNVWIPNQVGPDWTPYRYGRWAWTSQWGWSWVDDAPWGFAPFHYGRWVNWGGRWCWSPGQYVARPVYAPALVGWVGGPGSGSGGSISIGISIGGRANPPAYGWYPLAPRELYAPGYRHSPGYVQRINNDRNRDRDRDRAGDQRPRSNREVGGAISYLPGQGGAVRPMPVVDGRPARALPAPPARAELGALLPSRPVAPPAIQRPSADMPWRSDNLGRRDREREAERGARDQTREPARDRQPAPAPQSLGSPIMGPARPAVAPEIRVEPQQQRPPERVNEQRNDRIDRGDHNGINRAPGPERQFERPVERQVERQPERPQERGPERQVERPPERVRAAEPTNRQPPPELRAPPPQAQPQPQPQAQPQRAEENRGQPRGRQDQPGRGDRRERENER